jgi:RNA polymerase sigma-70 factor (ECF subfamily)
VPERDWAEVLRRIVEGDRLALVQASRVVNAFLARFGAYDFRDEWEDLVQEVVSAAALALREGRLREPRAALGFLWTTARFKYRDRLRIQLGSGKGERLAWEDVLSLELPPQQALGAEAREDLRRALARIPDKKREAVTAVYVGGLTYEEAARTTGIPLGTLKRYLRDGLAQLRDELSDRLEGRRSDLTGGDD